MHGCFIGNRSLLKFLNPWHLCLTWGCERFSEFLVGIDFSLQTDHKPLIPLLSTKNLEDVPPTFSY